MDKKTKILIVAIALALIVAIASTTYAYFTIANKEGEESVITSGTMGLHLEDGPEVGLDGALPGASVIKTFYVENTGNVDTAYDIYLSEVVNTFADKTDLVYTLTSNDGGYSTTGQVEVPSTSSKIVDSQAIPVSGIHHYTLTITFLNKNENQDDNQGKEFSGKIQINEYKEVGSNTGGFDPTEPINDNDTAAIRIRKWDLTSDEIITDDPGDNARYIGSDPHNYVYFNGELWRMIGAFGDRVKLVRNSNLGWYSWDSSVSSVNRGGGVNEWSQADLMNELNGDYLNTSLESDPLWQDSWYLQGGRSFDRSYALTLDSQLLIDDATWYLGAVNGAYDNYGERNYDTDVTHDSAYVYNTERGEGTSKVCETSEFCNDSVTRTTSWSGKVALIYPSDYLYATGGTNSVNRETCLNMNAFSWHTEEGSACRTNNWLNFDSSGYYFTISPKASHIYIASGVNYNSAFGVNTISAYDGLVGYIAATGDKVYPSVYLKAQVKFSNTAGEDGSEDHPYTLTL